MSKNVDDTYVRDISNTKIENSSDSEQITDSNKNVWLGVKIKKEFGFMQWLSIVTISCTTIFIGVYLNLQLTFLLTDKQFFGYTDEQNIQLSSDLTVYSIPLSLIATFFVGNAFEILGRRWTMFICYLFTSFVYLLFPYTSPDFLKLVFVRCLLGITMTGPLGHPLINDYVVKKYRGKAIALNGIGFICGEIFAMLLNFATIKETPFVSFSIASAIILFFAFFLFLNIKDPQMNKIRRSINQNFSVLENQKKEIEIQQPGSGIIQFQECQNSSQSLDFESKSTFQKMKHFVKIVGTQIKQIPILGMCVVGASINKLLSILFSIYLIIWIQNKLEKTDEGRTKAKELYGKIMIFSVLCSIVILPAVGIICDRISTRKIVSLSYLFRAFTIYQFCLLEKADCWQAYLICVLIVIGSIIENIVLDSIFFKSLPKETRGIFNGVYSFASQIGIAFFSMAASSMASQGPKFPFIMLGTLDVVYAIAFSLFLLFETKNQKTENQKISLQDQKNRIMI